MSARASRPLGAVGGILALMVVVVVGCSTGAGGDDEPLRVFAAASLSDAFADLALAFEADHPELDVELNLAGSSSLREQILDGAPADVVATANEDIMTELAAAGALAGPPRRFASNRLALTVPAGNPAGVSALADLADSELVVGLCTDAVPCGRLARNALDLAGIEAAPDTEEPDVRALLAKLVTGELDAGLVYRTDVVAAGDAVEAVPAPALDGLITTYPIAVVAGAADGEAADAFVRFVRSTEGAAILAEHGFGS